MNSSTSECTWPSPDCAHLSSLQIAQSQTELTVDIATAISTAIGSGLFTASIPVTSDLSVDVQYCMALLNQAGYAVSNDGTNIVVSW